MDEDDVDLVKSILKAKLLKPLNQYLKEAKLVYSAKDINDSYGRELKKLGLIFTDIDFQIKKDMFQLSLLANGVEKPVNSFNGVPIVNKWKKAVRKIVGPRKPTPEGAKGSKKEQPQK